VGDRIRDLWGKVGDLCWDRKRRDTMKREEGIMSIQSREKAGKNCDVLHMGKARVLQDWVVEGSSTMGVEMGTLDPNRDANGERENVCPIVVAEYG